MDATVPPSTTTAATDQAAEAPSSAAASKQVEPAARPAREPRIWLRRRGGIIVLSDSGERVVVQLMPREMRVLARKLNSLATVIDGEQPSRIGEFSIDE